MLSPAMLVLAAVSIFPFLYIIAMSFSLVQMIGGISFSWVGLDNWTRLVGDGAVWRSWRPLGASSSCCPSGCRCRSGSRSRWRSTRRGAAAT